MTLATPTTHPQLKIWTEDLYLKKKEEHEKELNNINGTPPSNDG